MTRQRNPVATPEVEPEPTEELVPIHGAMAPDSKLPMWIEWEGQRWSTQCCVTHLGCEVRAARRGEWTRYYEVQLDGGPRLTLKHHLWTGLWYVVTNAIPESGPIPIDPRIPNRQAWDPVERRRVARHWASYHQT